MDLSSALGGRNRQTEKARYRTHLQHDTAASRLLRPRMKLGLVPTLSRLQIDVMRSLDKHEWMVLIFQLGDPK